MKKKPTILRTPETIAAELAAAERELKQPLGAKRQTVDILPTQIKTRPELFQPRGFFTIGALDTDHVAKLARRIATKGELDPPLVVKLGSDWVCVDGHHRVAAYLKQPNGGWRSAIACQWFVGTVRDAVDESVRLNDVVKLEMRRGDRWEAAWQRVVLGWGSKKQICRLTGTSDGLVAMMRRVVAAHASKDGTGREFRKRLPSIEDASWSLARASYLNLSPAEYDERKAAANLARLLQDRLHGKLSENKKITAMALAIYDPGLPDPLAAELQRIKSEMTDEEEGESHRELVPELRDMELTPDLIEDLGRQRGIRARTARRIEDIERALRERGVNQDAGPEQTPSDATWESWVTDDVARQSEV